MPKNGCCGQYKNVDNKNWISYLCSKILITRLMYIHIWSFYFEGQLGIMVGPKEGECGQEPSSLRATRYYGWSQGRGMWARAFLPKGN